MKRLQNWILKIDSKEEFEKILKVLKDFDYDLSDVIQIYDFFWCFYCLEDKKVISNNYFGIYYKPYSSLKSYTLEDFIEAHKEFKDMKFKISSKEEDKRVQEHLFSLGYDWDNRGKEYYNPYEYENDYNRFLYTNERGYITHFNNEEYFNKKEVPEYTLQEIKTYELKEVPTIVCEKCGKKHHKDSDTYFRLLGSIYDCNNIIIGNNFYCKECLINLLKEN